MVRLFISYRSLDSAKVDTIVHNLNSIRASDGSKPYSTWQDKKDMPVGQNWWESIVDAIEACDIFVFHISQEALKSEVCKAELAYALQRNRFIIPIILEGEFSYNVATGKHDIDYWSLVPARLKNIQFLFHTGAALFDQFNKTIETYKRNPPRDTPAARPLNPDSSGAAQYTADVYDEAYDYALRLAFDEARARFLRLANSSEQEFAQIAHEWLDVLFQYEQLVKLDEKQSTRFMLKNRWSAYRTLFPKDFIDGIFDPKGLADQINNQTLAVPSGERVESPTPPVPATAPRVESPASPVPATAPRVESPTSVSMVAQQYLEQAETHRKNRDYDRAIADYTEAIRLNPQYAEAYNNRGWTYHAKNSRAHAIADYTEAIRLNPQYAEAYNNRGTSYEWNQDYDRAIADYTEVIRLNPQSAIAYYNRGNSYYKKQDCDRAIADYEVALKINPQYPYAGDNLKKARSQQYFGRAETHRKNEDYDRAIADYTEAIRLYPEDATAYYNRGNSYYAKQDYDRASADYKSALRIYPQHPSAGSALERARESKPKTKRRWFG